MKALTRNPKLTLTILGLIVLAVLVKIFLPFGTGGVQSSVAIAPEVLFETSFLRISNTLLTSWIVVILIALFAFLATRNMSLVPKGLQNVMELLIETLVGLTEQVAGPERGRKFFPIVATIFIYVLFANLVGLIPGFGPLGVIAVPPNDPNFRISNGQVVQVVEGKENPTGIRILGDAPSAFNAHEEASEVPVLAPFVRAPSTDVNMPLALALISVLMTQVYGMQAQGLKYWTRFFSFGRLLKGNIAFGLIDVFVGLVELISEIGKIIAFTFRLFGNLFAGEVVLLIMSFLFMLLPFIFYGLELFVAVIQAFVFFILSVAFMTIATTEHEAEGAH